MIRSELNAFVTIKNYNKTIVSRLYDKDQPFRSLKFRKTDISDTP